VRFSSSLSNNIKIRQPTDLQYMPAGELPVRILQQSAVTDKAVLPCFSYLTVTAILAAMPFWAIAYT
jgi:hypothetical protein